jgi:hypothetical protein
MDTALEMLRSQNEWLLENRTAINPKIQQGIAELDRGEGIPEDELDAYLDKLKADLSEALHSRPYCGRAPSEWIRFAATIRSSDAVS